MKIKERAPERTLDIRVTETELRVLAYGLRSLPINPQYTSEGKLIDWMEELRLQMLDNMREIALSFEP